MGLGAKRVRMVMGAILLGIAAAAGSRCEKLDSLRPNPVTKKTSSAAVREAAAIAQTGAPVGRAHRR